MHETSIRYYQFAIFQVLITPDSVRVHREVLKFMPVLRRLSRAKLNDDQVKTVSDVIDELANFCRSPYDKSERHAMNQSILINHGKHIIRGTKLWMVVISHE